MKISESVLREDAEDLVVDDQIESDGIEDILNTSEPDDIVPSDDVQIDIEANDADLFAGIEYDSDIPEDAEVVDVDEYPSDKELRLMDRENEDDEVAHDTINDDVIDKMIDQNTPSWVKEMEDDNDAASEVEDITDSELDEAANVEEYLNLMHTQYLFESYYANL